MSTVGLIIMQMGGMGAMMFGWLILWVLIVIVLILLIIYLIKQIRK